MSTPSSPPANAAYVPYQAYKSKRHSRNLSASANSHLVPNQSPPPVSKSKSNSPSTSGVPSTYLQPQQDVDSGDDSVDEASGKDPMTPPNFTEIVDYSAPISVVVNPPQSPDSPPSETLPSETKVDLEHEDTPEEPKGMLKFPTEPAEQPEVFSSIITTQGSSLAGSSRPSSSNAAIKKTSTFRRLPARSSHNLQPTTHSRNVSSASLPPRIAEKSIAKEPQETVVATKLLENVASPISAAPNPVHFNTTEYHLPSILPIQQTASHTSTSSATYTLSTNPPSRLSSPSTASSPKPAPYRPGFQPKGLYRPLTDEFVALRRSIHDGQDQGGITRVERTKLERRLEKLIELHFSRPVASEELKQGLDSDVRPSPKTTGPPNRRASSFFDFQSLRGLNLSDAGDLWRGVVSSGLGDTTKMDIRASEQRITPWQDDAEASKCPLCLAAFHPLTNRKHHCRLCGQIICSLPIKNPQRKTLCSTLFVVDSHTREIEEVGEGVDYGVKRRRLPSTGGQNSRQEDEDKFLKGVRICQTCRPVLLRQQYHQQVRRIPQFVRLYENFITLEASIEESLPRFQELLLSLNHHDQPTKEASAARKRLLESFARYDKLSKEIRALPCPNGPGSSQDRVQAAVMTRANLFLQKNMFPLQSLSTPKTDAKSATSTVDVNGAGLSALSVDPDSALAHALQPLLEQETLLETFVDEAQAQRKFEDVKTLKVNLAEIRQEIERIMGGKKL